MDDPCERGMHFNDTVAPYDKWQTRWALALAVNLQQASIATFSGMLRASPLAAPPTDVLMQTYDKPLASWLADFQLPDGYKPFDPNYATQLADTLRQQGVQDLPQDPDKVKDLLGVGWWKHDPQEAAKLLTDAGFKQLDGKWMTPDGKPWTITIAAPADFEVESQRLAFAIANEWNQFGVPTNVQPMQSGAFVTAESTGNYTVGSYWNGACAIIPDLFVTLEGWHKDYVRPTGTPASSNDDRYTDDQLSATIDKLRAMPTSDPNIVNVGNDMLKQLVKSMPAINMFGTSKFVPVNETYWKNYPSANNYYEGPWWWWSNFKFIVARIQPQTSH
jgi:peptide/nickel transport system substrate-binding protein